MIEWRKVLPMEVSNPLRKTFFTKIGMFHTILTFSCSRENCFLPEFPQRDSKKIAALALIEFLKYETIGTVPVACLKVFSLRTMW